MNIVVRLNCTECGKHNYTTRRAKAQNNKLKLKKYCSRCRKHTLHKEK